ncbi:MAG: caspase family protein, partial [Myxococcota bacterium]
MIGKQLEKQYNDWKAQKTKYPLEFYKALDPTKQDVRSLCLSLRQHARRDRVLFHYNGHGVPLPTKTGEIWVFDEQHTKYIPLLVADVRQWLGKPSIVILDCSSAGILLPFWDAPMGEEGRDAIVLAPTAEGEWLPLHPDYPADIFTSCLTTPIRMALRWFVKKHFPLITEEFLAQIPGKLEERKTPLGELNWMFTAVTDSIAWNLLEEPLFQKLFRQDLMVASRFRNFLLADRILRSFQCTPQSRPALPPGMADHPLWQAWDLSCETFLTSLQGGPQPPLSNGNEPMVRSPFFSEQLTAFEIWIEFAKLQHPAPLACPEQLPVVLQVLLYRPERVRALDLLRQFLDLGPEHVHLALSLGIFPYVMKLLQNEDYMPNLVSIWAKILAVDASRRIEVVDQALKHFVKHLTYGWHHPVNMSPKDAAQQRTLAAFILAVTCRDYVRGKTEAMRHHVDVQCIELLAAAGPDPQSQLRLPTKFRVWLILLLSQLVQQNVTTDKLLQSELHLRLRMQFQDEAPEVRAAAIVAISAILASEKIQESTEELVASPSLWPVPGLMPHRIVGTPQPAPPHHTPGAQPLHLAGDRLQPVGPGPFQPSYAPMQGIGSPWPPQPMLMTGPPAVGQQPTFHPGSMPMMAAPAPLEQTPVVAAPRPSVYANRGRVLLDLSLLHDIL